MKAEYNKDDEDKKTQLEIEKLEAEIKYYKKPFRNPNNWAALATIIAAAFALIWAASSGWFNNQNDILKTEKLILQLEIKQFEEQKKQINDSITLIAYEKEQLVHSVKKLESINEELKQKVITAAAKKRIEVDLKSIPRDTTVYAVTIVEYKPRMKDGSYDFSGTIKNAKLFLYKNGNKIREYDAGGNGYVEVQIVNQKLTDIYGIEAFADGYWNRTGRLDPKADMIFLPLEKRNN